MDITFEIHKLELLIKLGRELWDMTNGYQKQPILISKLAERLDMEENKVSEVLKIGEKIGLLKLLEDGNQICIGPVGSVCFIRN